MPKRQVETLWLGITKIEAQEQLRLNSVGDWPMMKQDAREKTHNELHALAYDVIEKNFVSIEEIQRQLANG